MAKVWIEAYGCSSSYADSEMISGMLLNAGYSIAQRPAESDLNLIVTCSVKDATARRMKNRIGKLKNKPLVVAGCLPKAEKDTVERIGPQASMMGPNAIGSTLEVVQGALEGQRVIRLDNTDQSKVGLPKIRVNPVVGIIEIASGCMSECTFCQTKVSKGGLKSYRIGDIVRQVQNEVSEGCKEIWLTSTDNGCYGFDIGTDLPTLVRSVSDVQGEFKIRVGMMNPMYMNRIKQSLLEAFHNDKVFKFIHIPVQSGSDAVLRQMKRGHTAKIFYDTVKRIQRNFDRFTVSTDIIVGFPTETKEDFEQTVELLKETRPDITNLSKYGARPGTKAAAMNDQIPSQEVKRRSKTIFDLQKKISHEKNKEWIGWKGEVLFDEKLPNENPVSYKGRNFAYKPVVVDDSRVDLGKKFSVRITDASTHGLYGELC